MKYTIHDPFVGRPDKYDMNVQGSAVTYVKAAYMDGPYGREPAIAIFRNRALLALLTPDHAIRIADAIADAVEQHESPVHAPL
ncbi:hypothetical protein [Arthrobacter sp. PAMC25284]|uniref:hypothetical protein n=1 Tax=Arthrobacter sp. PAMC25284 TaxID=2861279 RepID=UPI001C635F31|nr:hypothetical protein [Arthrobacter sp. PAMC25284]QYF89709.1 hypothetical protein KY499_17060 [Arthrobacter sp. PAMC25284]